jgi:hypothetical protein
MVDEHKNQQIQQQDYYNRIKKLAESTRKFLTIQSNTGMVLTFDASKAEEKIRSYKGNESWCVEFTVMTEDGYEKILRLALSWALTVNTILAEKGGKAKIKVIRSGEGTNTNYTFIPA